MKKIAIAVIFALVLGVFAGCTGTTVIYQENCGCETCPVQEGTPVPTETKLQVVTEGEQKLGLAIVGSAADSKDGEVSFEVTVVAVTVDGDGVITACQVDSLGSKVAFDTEGNITTDLTAPIATKNELADAYGMVAYGGAKYEWYQQAGALSQYAVGKTVEELKNGAIDETGYAPEGTDLASTATIYLGSYVSAIEKAVSNANAVGSQAGDSLKLAITAKADSSASATAEKEGTAQLDLDATALTVQNGVITGCVIDSLQAKVTFNAQGGITSDLTATMSTKNELGEQYGMVAWGGAKYEWNQQAANFANYVTGKTAQEVAGIAVTEGKPAEADLAATVTIAIGGFQALIAKALS